MEKFKKKIKFRFQLCTMYMCSGTMLYFLLQRLTENVPDFSKGMLTGLLVGGDLLALIYMIRCCILLRDEKKLKDAVILVTRTKKASASYLQGKLNVSFPVATRLMMRMEELGVVGRMQAGGRTREVLWDEDSARDFVESLKENKKEKKDDFDFDD